MRRKESIPEFYKGWSIQKDKAAGVTVYDVVDPSGKYRKTTYTKGGAKSFINKNQGK
jgi:hypothetical protein